MGQPPFQRKIAVTKPLRFLWLEYLLIVAMLILGAWWLTACGSASKATHSTPDTVANRADQNASADIAASDNTGAEQIAFPDGYGNIATKCDHGNRLYVSDGNNTALSVIPNDPTCSAIPSVTTTTSFP